ncbi:MAG: terminase large subunit domain-containing protein [Pseudomonadota bacterium]
MNDTCEQNADLSDLRNRARGLYWQGWTIQQISEELDIKYQRVYAWKRRGDWEKAAPISRVEATLEDRLVQLIAKENKVGKDFKEIDLLMRQQERLARVHRYSESGKESDLNPKIHNRNKAPKKFKPKNDVPEDGVIQVIEKFEEELFDYQRVWYQAGKNHRNRNILKSRQIGATWFFAREAICDALETGKNKIFLSASKAQAHIFRSYIVQFVLAETGVELKGDPIRLPNGAELFFLGTNAQTAQGYHGDVYMDEYFWIGRFKEFKKVTSGMAMHKKWSRTYFSTPSAITHEAYPFWSGEDWKKHRPKEQQIDFDVSHEALAKGALCPDNQWRQIVTVEDAIRGGCDLFDLDDLRQEYSQEEWQNLLMCEFMDDTLSVFPLPKLQACMVDSWIQWRELKPFAAKPLGDSPVWVGYDPSSDSEQGDGAGLIVLSPSKSKSQKHRVIEKHRLRGMDYEAQANFILALRSRYQIEYCGIDTTGAGAAVAELVEKKMPCVRRLNYSPELKAQMVMKTLNVIDHRRLEFDAGWSDLAQSFMAIRRAMTDAGRKVTYIAGRRKDTGHAELAWATMHAIFNEPLEGPSSGTSGSIIEIYE